MNRRALAYLSISLPISLTIVSLVFGSLSFAAAETSIVPAGLTETFTPVLPTETPALTNTPSPTETPVLSTETPAPTNTPVPTETPVPTNTPAPTSAPEKSNTPVSTPASTPTAPAVVGLPNTGGAAPLSGASPWVLVLIVGTLGTLALGLSIRAYRPTQQ